eukprot:3288733-Amphidinium_carterae.2
MEALRLWERIQKQLPPFMARYGPPTLDFEFPGDDLAAWSVCVLRATYVHFSACLNSELVQARQHIEQTYRQKVLAHGCINGTVSARLGQTVGAGACSLVVDGSRTFLPTELFPLISSYWRPLMEATDHGCSAHFLAQVVEHVPQGQWELPDITVAGLADILAKANKSSAPGPDNC